MRELREESFLAGNHEGQEARRKKGEMREVREKYVCV
jgi:hypothetical protein